jgi:hypothetical protein
MQLALLGHPGVRTSKVTYKFAWDNPNPTKANSMHSSLEQWGYQCFYFDEDDNGVDGTRTSELGFLVNIFYVSANPFTRTKRAGLASPNCSNRR